MKKRIVFCLIACLVGFGSCDVAKNVTGKIFNKKQQEPERPRSELSLAENVGKPLQHEKTALNLRTKVLQEVKELKQVRGLKVSTVRDGEVIRISIEAAHLFQPNEMMLKEESGQLLTPILPFVKDPGSNVLLLAAYTDNTGSDKYLQQLSQARVNAVRYWFRDQGVDSTQLVGYAMGSADPRVPNISFTNRAQNRRVDLYLVPSEEMLSKARRGKLK